MIFQFDIFILTFVSFRCGGYMMPEFLKTPVKRDLYPFEKRYFADEPCEDYLNASNETFSTLKLLNQR